MNLTFVGNACNVIEFEGVKLLTDPWLIEGAFEGSWFHYPPLKHTPEDFKDVDGIYISHVHPDHYCPESLRRIGDKPLLILRRKHNILKNTMIRDGFTNIIEFDDNVTTEWKNMKLTMFDAFVGNPFTDTEFGNPLDSALLVQCGDQSVFNTNDNTPDLAACHNIRAKYGRFDIAQLNYNAAGPYPACFSNLSLREKQAEHGRLVDRNIKHMIGCAKILEPRYVQPFAGAYILGGKLASKNDYLGTTNVHYAADRLNDAGIDAITEVEHEMNGKYLVEIANKQYPYELDSYPGITMTMLTQAKANMDHKAQIMGKPPSKMLSVITQNEISLYFEGIKCSLDSRLMWQILNKKAHWNNAEIGCHVEFYRDPNVYDYDFHMMMSFFHL